MNAAGTSSGQTSKQKTKRQVDDQESAQDVPAMESKTSRRSAYASRMSTVGIGQGPETSMVKAKEAEKEAHSTVRTLQKVRVSDELHGIYSLCYSPSGEMIVCGFGNGTVQFRASDGASLKQTIRLGIGLESVPIMWVRYDRKNGITVFAASACGVIFACNDSGEFSPFAKEGKNEVNALDVNIEGDALLSGGRDSKVRLYDIQTQKLLHVYQSKATMGAVKPAFRAVHSERVFAVRAHPNLQHVFLTGGWDNAVKIWDIREKNKCINTLFGPHICGDCIDMKNDSVITGCWSAEKSLLLWDMRMYKLIEVIEPVNREKTNRGEFLYTAKYFDGDPYGDKVLVAGSGLLNVEIISIGAKKVLGKWRTLYPVHAIDSHRSFITYGGAESVLRMCEFL